MEHVLEAGKSYRLRVNLFGPLKYREYQYYKFVTNTPPSVGDCEITPDEGEYNHDNVNLFLSRK